MVQTKIFFHKTYLSCGIFCHRVLPIQSLNRYTTPPCTDSQQEDSLGLASTKIQLQHQEIPKPRVIGMIPGGSITIFLPCSYPLPQYRYWPKDPGVYGCFISLTTCDLEMLKETNTIQCTLKDKGLDHLF